MRIPVEVGRDSGVMWAAIVFTVIAAHIEWDDGPEAP